jgi:hypothetical protein
MSLRRRSNSQPRRRCNLDAGQRLQSDRRAGRRAAVNAAVCARRSALAISRDGKASLRTRPAPKAASPPQHWSTMTGALFTGIVKNWVADQNSAGR